MTKTELQKRKEYDKFINEQLEILKGHFDRTMLKVINKIGEIWLSEKSGKAN